MPDQKITELTELTTPIPTDILPIVDDPTGTPATKKVQLSNLVGAIRIASYFGSNGQAIQDAIDDLPASGGVVYIPPGTWTLSAGLTIPSNVYVFGAGPSTIIKYPTGSTTIKAFMNSDTVGGNTDIRLSNLLLDMNVTNRSGSPQDTGIAFDNVERLTVDNIFIKDSKWVGLYVLNITHGLFDKIVIDNMQDSGLGVTVSDRCRITNCIVTRVAVNGGAGDGIRIIGRDINIDNCVVYNSNYRAFAFENNGAGDPSRRCTMTNCIAYFFKDAGVYLAGSQRCQVVNNFFRQVDTDGTTWKSNLSFGAIGIGPGDHNLIANNIIDKCHISGIYLGDNVSVGTTCKNNSLIDNIIHNSGGDGTSQWGAIKLYSGAVGAYVTENLIEGNIIIDTQGTPTTYCGIQIFNGNTEGNIVRGNTIIGCRDMGITIGATDTIIENNYCKNNGKVNNDAGIVTSGGQRCVIRGNHCWDDQGTPTQMYGIHHKTSINSNAKISGNYCYKNKREGILISDSSHLTVNDNTCLSNGQQTNNTYAGIKIADSNKVAVVGNNSAGSSQKYGIESTGTSDQLAVVGNVITDNGTSARSLSGSSNQVSANIE